jgi:hypothetical protein
MSELDHRFSGRIVDPEWMPGWCVIEIPGSQELLGTGKSVKVEGTVDGVPFSSGLMPTGRGFHFLSVSAAFRKKLGKAVGDPVEVHLTKRLS